MINLMSHLSLRGHMSHMSEFEWGGHMRHMNRRCTWKNTRNENSSRFAVPAEVMPTVGAWWVQKAKMLQKHSFYY